MIPIPSKADAFEGTRILRNDFGLSGVVLYDPKEEGRNWTISSLYLPLRRKIGGVRAKCVDQKGFVSFINQRDLELVLGIGKPGGWCKWLGDTYPETDDPSFYGFCMDTEDVFDDLYDKELLIRAAQTEVTGQVLAIPQGTDVSQLIHYDARNDAIRRCLLIADRDAEFGICPDPRLETLNQRWAVYENEKVEWWKL